MECKDTYKRVMWVRIIVDLIVTCDFVEDPKLNKIIILIMYSGKYEILLPIFGCSYRHVSYSTIRKDTYMILCRFEYVHILYIRCFKENT
jgi:hypothetical protein